MAKHALLFVHGMGEQVDGWHLKAVEVLETAFAQYQLLKAAKFADMFEPIAVSYSGRFSKLRERWKADVSAIKTTLAQELDTDDVSSRSQVEKRIDKVSNFIGAGEDSFVWTHMMDVILYRFFGTVRQAVNADVGSQFLDNAGSKHKTWSVVAHSLGTAVTHNTLHALYNTDNLVAGKSRLRPQDTRPLVLMMAANVSRVLQLPGLKAFGSEVKPGPPLARRLCGTYLNVRHKFDPFTVPQPFDPDPSWPDVQISHSPQYQHIRPAHLLIDKLRDVHDLEHYLRNPRVHVPLFRAVLAPELIPEAEFTEACKEFDSAVVTDNINALRNQLDALQPSASDEWVVFIELIKKLFS